MQFEFYVLNYDFNKRTTEMFNIFRNCHVQKCTEKAIKKYLRSPTNYKYEYSSIFQKEPLYGFDALCEEIDYIIKWQECGRCQYEICAGYKFEQDINNMKAWDCWEQAHANIRTITYDCIRQYKEQLKNKKEN